MAWRAIVCIAAAAVLAGCGGPERDEETVGTNLAGNAAAPAAAEGKAEEGRLSIEAPGVDIAINVPASMRGRARAEADSELMPPGAEVSGLHVAGNGGDQAAGRDSVELRFTAAQPVDRIAAWYRDPARAQDFTIASARREGEDVVLTGANRDGGPISVRLRARGQGTDGRLVLSDRD
jgi:hypothetical protein